MFSFNSPLGACPECKGLGFLSAVSEDLLVPDDNLCIAEGAIRYLKNIIFTDNIEWQMYRTLFEYYNIDLYTPYKLLSDEEKKIIMYGSLEPIDYQITSSGGVTFKRNKPIEGVASLIQRRYYETNSSMSKDYYSSFMKDVTCSVCEGKRLSRESLSVQINGKNIIDFTNVNTHQTLLTI